MCAAAAFFKIRPSEVRAPRPSVAGESDEAPREEGSAGDSAAGTAVIDRLWRRYVEQSLTPIDPE